MAVCIASMRYRMTQDAPALIDAFWTLYSSQRFRICERKARSLAVFLGESLILTEATSIVVASTLLKRPRIVDGMPGAILGPVSPKCMR